MKSSTARNLIFNALGVLTGLVAVGYVVYEAFRVEQESPCSTRYPAPTRFALHANGGEPLTQIELQARAGLQEWGVIDNATVVRAPQAPAGAALQVKLAMLPSGGEGDGRAHNGIDFRWAVPGVAAASGACLSYSVWLPEGFAFNRGGVLPGIVGAKPGETSGFGTRLQWSLDGAGEFAVAAVGSGFRPISQAAIPLAQGRWMSIEQELVLNAPGQVNGLARLWIDGKLKSEDTTVQFRADDAAKLTGVHADIGYKREPAKPGELRLSAFELAWR